MLRELEYPCHTGNRVVMDRSVDNATSQHVGRIAHRDPVGPAIYLVVAHAGRTRIARKDNTRVIAEQLVVAELIATATMHDHATGYRTLAHIQLRCVGCRDVALNGEVLQTNLIAGDAHIANDLRTRQPISNTPESAAVMVTLPVSTP